MPKPDKNVAKQRLIEFLEGHAKAGDPLCLSCITKSDSDVDGVREEGTKLLPCKRCGKETDWREVQRG